MAAGTSELGLRTTITIWRSEQDSTEITTHGLKVSDTSWVGITSHGSYRGPWQCRRRRRLRFSCVFQFYSGASGSVFFLQLTQFTPELSYHPSVIWLLVTIVY